MSNESPDIEAIVVGGSFAGLSAAMQLARARRRVLVIDGGKPRNRYAEHAHGFLAQDGRAPHEIMRDASDQLRRYPKVEFFHGQAVAARRADDGESFALDLEDGRTVHGRSVVLATGLRDELPPVAGLQERWGKTVLHCPYCHGYEVGGRPLGVLANHPMSTHQAVILPDWGPTTYFTQGKFEPDEATLAHLKERGVAIERSPIVELLGHAPQLEAVRVADGRVLKLAAIFTAPTLRMASPMAHELGCAFEEGPLGPYIKVDDVKQTSVPGVFAAGDAASPMHNATLASAAGVMAGFGAHRRLMGL